MSELRQLPSPLGVKGLFQGRLTILFYITLLLLTIPHTTQARKNKTPHWTHSTISSTYPAKDFLTAVGIAPLGDDLGASLEQAELRARATLARQLESQINATFKAQSQETTKTKANKTTRNEFNWISDQIRVKTQAELLGVKLADQYIDQKAKQVYALVILDLNALQEKARQELAVFDPIEFAYAKAKTTTDLAANILNLSQLLKTWPTLPKSVDLLSVVDAKRANQLLSLLVQQRDVELLLTAQLKKFEFHAELKPPQPVRGSRATLMIEHNAPGLPLILDVLPRLLSKPNITLGDSPLEIQLPLVFPTSTGMLAIRLLADPAKIHTTQDLFSAQLPVQGTAATRLITTSIAGDCPADSKELLEAMLARCTQEAGFASKNLASVAPTMDLTFSKQGFQGIYSQLKQVEPLGDQLMAATLTCAKDQRELRSDYRFVQQHLTLNIWNTWLNQPSPQSTQSQFTAAGAGQDDKQSLQSAIRALEEKVCGW